MVGRPPYLSSMSSLPYPSSSRAPASGSPASTLVYGAAVVSVREALEEGLQQIDEGVWALWPNRLA